MTQHRVVGRPPGIDKDQVEKGKKVSTHPAAEIKDEELAQVLGYIDANPGKSAGEIRSAVELPGPTSSALIARAEQEGWVFASGPEDAITLTLADAGKEQLSRLRSR